jgi:hypothetical protein
MLDFGPERLEPRVVPTIVFPAQYGNEIAFNNGGWQISHATVQLVFWGSSWQTSSGAWTAAAQQDIVDAELLVTSSYYSKIGQYLGTPPTFQLPAVVEDSSATPGNVGSGTLYNDLTTLLNNDINVGKVAGPVSSFFSPTTATIYVVITPASTGVPNEAGWNSSMQVEAPKKGISGTYAGLVWLDGGLSADGFSTAMGHELAENMTDPIDPTGTFVSAGLYYYEDNRSLNDLGLGDQIADHEARDYSYRLDGTLMVQPYWSQADEAYVVADGTSYNFQVTGGSHSQFSEGTGSTLTIQGGQAGLSTNDSVTVNRTAAGAVSVSYDGQGVAFDPGAIGSVVIDGAGTGMLTVTITGVWTGIAGTNPPVTVVGSSTGSTTIDVEPAAGALPELSQGLVSVYSPANTISTLNIIDTQDSGDNDWTINGPVTLGPAAPVGVDGYRLALYTGAAPTSVNLATGTGMNDIDVEATPEPVTIDDQLNETGDISFAQDSQSLAGFRSQVSLYGGATLLIVDDQADTANETVAFDNGTFLQENATSGAVAGMIYTGVGAVVYNAGTGVDSFVVAPFSGSLDAVATDLYLNGNGSDTLSVNDSRHAAPTAPAGAYGRQDSYALTGSSITRASEVFSYSGISTSSEVVTYSGMGGGLTFDADDYGTPVSIEGTATTTTVALGTEGTSVSVDAQSESLQNLAGVLNITNGSASDTISVNDRNDPGLSNASGPARYALNAASITRTDYYRRYFPLFGWQTIAVPHTINYSAVGQVTLSTDNEGSSVDVEGAAAPTTIEMGSGNTAVTVASTAGNLGVLGADLMVYGGSGTDTLSVNDSLDPLASGTAGFGFGRVTNLYSYDVSGSDIARVHTTRGYFGNTSSTARNIFFSGIKGGVTLDADNNGTPVYAGPASTSSVKVVGGTGGNTLVGPAMDNSWALTGTNAGTLDGWLSYTGFANLDGGGVADSFDFSPGGLVTGSIAAGAGNNWLNYARVSAAVTVNLGTGSATDVDGTVSGIEGVVGGSTSNVLTGSSRSLLIGGQGVSQLVGGAGDNLMLAGTTTYDLNDVALEAILTEWDRTDLDFEQRLTDLLDGGPGSDNGSYDINLETFVSNGHSNTITSNAAGSSWIFCMINDVIIGRKPSDVVM